MRIFVTGAKGYVGRALVKSGCYALVCDITNLNEVEAAVKSSRPDLVLHLAGKSSIAYCEAKEHQEDVIKTNVRGTHNVMYALAKQNLPGVLLSSDHIWAGGFFEGEYLEYAKPSSPANYYGMSKTAAEAIARSFDMKTIRTSFLFDAIRLSEKIKSLRRKELLVEPTFIKRSFMYLPDFVADIRRYCDNFYKMPSVLHLSGGRTVSWFGFMKSLAKAYELDPNLVKPRRIPLRESCAPRPRNGGLDVSLARELGFPYVDYESGLKRMYDEQN